MNKARISDGYCNRKRRNVRSFTDILCLFRNLVAHFKTHITINQTCLVDIGELFNYFETKLVSGLFEVAYDAWISTHG